MPGSCPDVFLDLWTELDLNVRGRSRVHAERMRERFVRQILDGREAFIEQRDLADSFDRKGADLPVFRNMRQEVQTALCVSETVRVHEVPLHAFARFRIV